MLERFLDWLSGPCCKKKQDAPTNSPEMNKAIEKTFEKLNAMSDKELKEALDAIDQKKPREEK